MAEIDDRVRNLEKTLAFLSGGALVAAVLILGFFGYANFYQIPEAVKYAVPDAVNNYVDNQVPGLPETLKNLEDDAKNASTEAVNYARQGQESADLLQKLLNDARENSVELHIESGRVLISDQKFPDLQRPGNCKKGVAVQRGAKNQRISFNKTFRETPEVIVALAHLDHKADGKNLRLHADVLIVDKTGFNYQLITWCNTYIYGAGLSWIAYGYRMESE